MEITDEEKYANAQRVIDCKNELTCLFACDKKRLINRPCVLGLDCDSVNPPYLDAERFGLLPPEASEETKERVSMAASRASIWDNPELVARVKYLVGYEDMTHGAAARVIGTSQTIVSKTAAGFNIERPSKKYKRKVEPLVRAALCDTGKTRAKIAEEYNVTIDFVGKIKSAIIRERKRAYHG